MKYEKIESYTIPESYRIGYVIGNQIQLAFPDEIEEFTRQDEEGNEQTMYRYYEYVIKVFNREESELRENVESNLEVWQQFAKETFLKEKSAEIRTKRNELLAESDQYFLLDRVNIELPSEVTASSLLTSVKDFFGNLKGVLNGDWAEYRQALRDITEQPKFPYEVQFPIKPTDKVEEDRSPWA